MTPTPSTQCDVVILGGGPAGTATALSLLKHNPTLKVVIVERSAYDTLRIGETLPPQARLLLEQLDIWSAFQRTGHLPSYGTVAAWGNSTLHANDSFFDKHGNGWHLDRCAFDASFANAAKERGAIVYVQTRFLDSQRLPDDTWQLTIRPQRSVPTQLNARFVVDATGRLAQFAHQQGAKRIIYDGLTGVAVILKMRPDSVDTFTLVETEPNGWWYSALLPDSRMIAMYMSDAAAIRRQKLKNPANWLAQARQTQHTWARLQKAEPLVRPFTQAAYTQCLSPVGGPGWLAVGDAASTFDPLSAHGIYKALHAGIYASYAILDWFKGQSAGLERYAAIQTADFKQYLATWANYYNLEQRWPESDFWKHRHDLDT